MRNCHLITGITSVIQICCSSNEIHMPESNQPISHEQKYSQSQVSMENIPLPIKLDYVQTNSIPKKKRLNEVVSFIKKVVSSVNENMPDLGLYKDSYVEHLRNKNIVIILNNSSSMNEKVKNMVTENSDVKYEVNLTIYQDMCGKLLYMLQALLKSGVESIHVEFMNPLYILNNGRPKKIKEIPLNFKTDSIQDLYKALVADPVGRSPVTTTLERLVKKYNDDEKPTHFILFTNDNPCPNNFENSIDGLKDTVGGFEEYLRLYFSDENSPNLKYKFSYVNPQDEDKRRTINIITCSGNNANFDYLNQLASKSMNIDVTGDYQSFIEQIKFHLELKSLELDTFQKRINAYIYKALVGCLDPEENTPIKYLNSEKEITIKWVDHEEIVPFESFEMEED